MKPQKIKWKRLKPKQYRWLRDWYIVDVILILACTILKKFIPDSNFFIMGVTITSIGVLATIATTLITYKTRKKSCLIENFIRTNTLLQSHIEIRYGILGETDVEVIDYYPQVDYSESPDDNVFRLRFRLDGSIIGQKLRDLEQPLSDMFFTVCTDIKQERGYVTYYFQLKEENQVIIKSPNDILPIGENEIAFTKDILWDWKRTPHLLVTGNTGSGKTQLVQYIIACLLEQGVRVLYCDPKNDDDMRIFLRGRGVPYATKEDEIARIVREIEEEVRKREKSLEQIKSKEYDFRPVFLFFDELIAFSKISDKKTYNETFQRLASIIVTGRSKRVYAGVILQRPDTSFIEGAIRENLSCKICMGQMSETAYTMSYGSDFAHIKNYRHEMGSGLIFRQGIDTKPREFLAPFICEGALYLP